MGSEQAATGGLATLLARIGEGLDDYLKFEHPDALHPDARWREHLEIPLPQQGAGIERVMQELLQELIPNGSAIPRPGFSGFITTGATSVSVVASTAAAIASPQRYGLNAFNLIEELSLNWLAEMCSIGHLKGVYSSGGSVANLVALGGARQAAFEALGLDPAADGLDRPVAVYASDQCHHTIQRSCGVLGIGRRAVRVLPSDGRGRMRVDALRQALERDRDAGTLPMAIVANAGTTNTGAIDPLQAIGEIAREHAVWFHVDGAYGLPGILDERVRPHYRGLELADSVIVDPHKWLGASVGVAATFVRDREILKRAFTQEPADYLEGSADHDAEPVAGQAHSMDQYGIPYFDYGVELSSPARGVVVWAMIREIGVEGMRHRIRRHNDMAASLARIADSHPELELLQPPMLSVCCFRYVGQGGGDLDRLNERLHRRLVRENQFLPSTTRVDGKLALRPCFIGARAEPEQVQGLVDAVLRIGRELAG